MTWCLVFAAVHLFWAAGGTTGLASSAGRRLAHDRPTAFVFGLFGVAALLVVGVLLVVTAVGRLGPSGWSRPAGAVTAVVGMVLLLRGAVVELLLATDVGGVRAAVGPLESRWSLVLWNPWFVLGGALFVGTAVGARRRSPGEPIRP